MCLSWLRLPLPLTVSPSQPTQSKWRSTFCTTEKHAKDHLVTFFKTLSTSLPIKTTPLVAVYKITGLQSWSVVEKFILFDALPIIFFYFFYSLNLFNHFNKPRNLFFSCTTPSVGKGNLSAPSNTSLKYKEREETNFIFSRRGCTTRRTNRHHILLVCFRGYACL